MLVQILDAKQVFVVFEFDDDDSGNNETESYNVRTTSGLESTEAQTIGLM